MINIRTLNKIEDNGGLTLKRGKPVQYKTGWQVADAGVECASAQEAMKAIKSYGGTCGVWLSNGIWYIDHSFRVNTKKEAMAIGRAHNQQSVLKWSNMSLAWC